MIPRPVYLPHVAPDAAAVFRVIGLNPDVDATVEDICEVAITTPPTAGMPLAVFSSSEEDGSAGTGVQSVTIEYLDEYGIEQSVDLVTEGTDGAAVDADDIADVQDMYASGVGTDGVAAGDIQLCGTDGVGTFGHISTGKTGMLRCAYKVPAARTAWLQSWAVSNATNAVATVTLSATCDKNGVLTPDVFHLKDVVVLLQGTVGVQFATPLEVPAGATVKVTGTGTSNVLRAVVEGWLAD